MSKREKQFADELTTMVRPATRNFILSVLLDIPANAAARVDFGIDSQKHYEALYYPIRAEEIMPKELDAALGDGAKLTAMTREAASNPHKDIEFRTSWDLILGRKSPERVAKDAFKKVLDGTSVETEATEPSKDHGIER